MSIKTTIILRIILIILFTMTVLVNFGCCVYSFTGASVPAHLQTIAIPVAEDRSGSSIAGLREQLTEGLIQKFIDDNSLQVTERTTANAILECVITSVADAPSIVSAGEEITSRRITITVKVDYKDLVQRTTIFDKSFSNYGDYEPGGATSTREGAITDAVDKISEDILLAVVSGW
jgi:hypothetical protein